MSLLAASHVSMHFTGPLLLDDVTVDIHAGAKIGLIGRNGSGKSTLLRLLEGQLEPTAGRVLRQRGVTVAYQEQELVYRPGATVFEEMREVFARAHRREERLRALEERLADDPDADEQRRLLSEYERLQGEQEAEGQPFDLDRRIGSMLASLGLPESSWHQPVDRFSGGERNIIGLARVLLTEPDVMLLDEPSNHLDMEGVEWFIRFLRRSPSAVLMVSHNRHLLDATTNEIWELQHKKVTRWAGNYSEFQSRKAEAIALQERQFKTQSRLIERIQFQARRLMDMANAYDDPGQAKRAKAMLRRIDRMDKVERPDTAQKRFHASLKGGSRHGRIALEVKDFSFSFGDRVLFEEASLEIEFGERVCLVGPNGSGKTTLLRQLLETGSWDNPTLRLGKSAVIGEYRQLHDRFDPGASLQEWVAKETGLPYSAAAALLHRFLFSRDDLERRIDTLSGGEKSRLQLARLVHGQVNLLVLDEPTNHLDIQACEQLEEMLQEFEGTLLIVSHDRYFLDKLVDRVVEVKDRKLADHRRSFAEWWQEHAGIGGRKGALEDRRKPAEGKQEARAEFEKRRAQQRETTRLRSRLTDLETRIEQAETRQEELKRKLEAAYSEGNDLRRAESLSRKLDALKNEIASLYTEWDEAAAALGEQ